MPMFKHYCLNCYKPSTGCKCNQRDKWLLHSPKLRPPRKIIPRAKFRRFLDACPQFGNMRKHCNLEAEFQVLLEKVKYKKEEK